MKIGNIDTDKKVLIVAEIGNNHEGNFDHAKNMVGRASDCGVDAIKFQVFNTKYFISDKDQIRFNRLKSFELNHQQFLALRELAHSLGLLFIATPLDLESCTFLSTIVDAIKISSGDNNFFPLLDTACRFNLPMIISTGLLNDSQLKRSVQFVTGQKKNLSLPLALALLHCVSAYPPPNEQINLLSIPHLIKEFPETTVGYSDHSIGVEASLSSVSLGARILEKHFTLDKNYSDFRDHKISSDPTEMTGLVNSVRKIEDMLGEENKEVQACEEINVHAARRSIVANGNLPKGHKLTMADLTWIRPAKGLNPGEEHLVIGKILNQDVSFGEILNLEKLELPKTL